MAQRKKTKKNANRPAHHDSPVHRWVAEQFPDEDLWTYSEVADHIGKKALALRRWVRDGLIDPPAYVVEMGDNQVYLFDEADVARFAAFNEVLRPGRRTDEYMEKLREVGSRG